jgi:hypothetical protein
MKIKPFLNKIYVCLIWFLMIGNCHISAQEEFVILDSINYKTQNNSEIKLDTVSNSNQEIEINLNKRNFKFDYKISYDENAFVYEASLENKSSWWTRFKEKLAHFFKSIFKFNNDIDSINFVDYLIKTLAVIIVIIVVYLITKSILNKEGQWIFGKSSTKSILHFEDVEKNMHLVDFEKLIQETLANGNERLAIRYYYLWVLRILSDQKLIEWDIEKTNSDYLYEIKDEQIRENYAYLSYLYNNIWYGAFEITEVVFENAKKSFEQTLKILRK